MNVIDVLVAEKDIESLWKLYESSNEYRNYLNSSEVLDYISLSLGLPSIRSESSPIRTFSDLLPFYEKKHYTSRCERSNTLRYCLFLAIYNGNIEAVRKIIENNRYRITDIDRYLSYLYSSGSGRDEITKYLISLSPNEPYYVQTGPDNHKIATMMIIVHGLIDLLPFPFIYDAIEKNVPFYLASIFIGTYLPEYVNFNKNLTDYEVQRRKFEIGEIIYNKYSDKLDDFQANIDAVTAIISAIDNLKPHAYRDLLDFYDMKDIPLDTMNILDYFYDNFITAIPNSEVKIAYVINEYSDDYHGELLTLLLFNLIDGNSDLNFQLFVTKAVFKRSEFDILKILLYLWQPLVKNGVPDYLDISGVFPITVDPNRYLIDIKVYETLATSPDREYVYQKVRSTLSYLSNVEQEVARRRQEVHHVMNDIIERLDIAKNRNFYV